MLRNLISYVQDVTLRRPRPVIVGSLLLTAVAVVLGTQVEFRTSRSELAPPDDPDQQRWNILLQEYSGSESLIACVEAAPGRESDPDRLRAVADELASGFAEDERIESVFHRIDIDWFLRRGLYLLPRDTLTSLRGALESEGDLLLELPEVTNLARLNELLARRLERGREEGTAIPEKGGRAIESLTGLLRYQRRFLEHPREAVADLGGTSPLLALAGERAPGLPGGYLGTRDGETLFVIASTTREEDDLGFRRALVTSLRTRADAVLADHPGIRVGFTGQPALVVEEMQTIRSDTWRTSLVAMLGVSLLTFLVFRWRSHSFLVLGSLAMGIAWSFGAVLIELGYLNLITSSFISTLIGVGVAYGIHPVSEYELTGAHTSDDVPRLIRRAFETTGPGVLVAGVTTAVAFFSIQLMRFRGFAELGIVAGFGVLLCLTAALVTLPAMLVVYGTRRHDRRVRRRAAVVDRFWVDLAAGKIVRFPMIVTVLAIAITAAMGWLAVGHDFDTNILDLLPRSAESVRYQRKMALESDLSPQYNIVVAGSLDELRTFQAAAANEPSISRFQSVLDFLPVDVEASEELRSALASRLDRTDVASEIEPLEADDLLETYERLEEVLAASVEDAFGAGLSGLVGPLEEARAEAEACLEVVEAADDAQVHAWNEAQPALFTVARNGLDRLRETLDAEPPTLDNLPRTIRQRFMTRDGRMLGLLFPVGSVFEPRQLAEYVAASRRVSPEATGFPLVFHKMSQRISSGFYRAVALGLVLVSVVLLIDFRSLVSTLLALLPLGLGVVWMLGGMSLLDISFNFANLVAVPLIIGVGIDNGVHVVHRIRQEGRQGMGTVLTHTGRAIVIASFTTMIGFGSLALASHRGIASLGLVLLLGVGSCLITSTVVLPNLLVALRFVDR